MAVERAIAMVVKEKWWWRWAAEEAAVVEIRVQAAVHQKNIQFAHTGSEA